MAPALSKLTSKQLAFGAVLAHAAVFGVIKGLQIFAQGRRSKIGENDSIKKKNGVRKSGLSFYRDVFRILKIMFPSVWSSEVLYLFLIAASLISRTYCDLFMISNTTNLESAIIRRKGTELLKHVRSFVLFIPFMALANSSLKFTLSELTLRIRTRLSKHLYNEYMKGNTYYQITNLDGRISNADQILTQDVEKFCDSLTDFYSNISKPLLEILIYFGGISMSLGIHAPITIFSSMIVAASISSYLRKPVAQLTAMEQKLEGEYRHVNSRLITSSEEIAFYRGNAKEKLVIENSLDKLVRHVRKFNYFRLFTSFVDNIFIKYIFGRLSGVFVLAVPYLVVRTMDKVSEKQRLEFYYNSGRMLMKLAESFGRIALANRELAKLKGFTVRVSELLDVLGDLNQGCYKRSMVTDQQTNGNAVPFVSGAGKVVIRNNIIKFDRVPLITPNGDVLVKELNFTVESGMNVLVCGPNGCGKSSLFRILGGLWPLFGGELTKPEQGKLFYVPQKPYMTIGTLRDQIIYPDSREEMQKKGITDEMLVRFLETVQLSYILDREGGWDAVQEWLDVLSGGEKQRVAMARLFYHKPQFAILDECTSAVSIDVEGTMYEYCREVGITLFTVSHRKSLWKFHEFYLHMDGRGSFEYKPIDPDTEEFGS